MPEEVEEGVEREMRFYAVGRSRRWRLPCFGMRAVVAGTGLDVWEFVAVFREHGESVGEHFPWLSGARISSALAHYELYPEEIDARIEREEGWTPERLWSEYPFMRPGDVSEGG